MEAGTTSYFLNHWHILEKECLSTEIIQVMRNKNGRVVFHHTSFN